MTKGKLGKTVFETYFKKCIYLIYDIFFRSCIFQEKNKNKEEKKPQFCVFTYAHHLTRTAKQFMIFKIAPPDIFRS